MKRRLLKLLLALTAVLLTFEVGLQLTSWEVQRQGIDAAVERGPSRESTRILSVGDSHTFGAGVERHQAYPAQLEVVLEERHPGRAFEVWNLGVPGVNTAYVAKRLEAQVVALEPDLVIVWVGTNNMWNTLEVGEGGAAGGVASLHRALLNLKLYRLGVVLWHTREGAFEPLGTIDSPDAQREERKRAYRDWIAEGKERSSEKVEQSLSDDIRRMVAIARAMEVPIIFTTYPQRRQELPVSEIIERMANELDVPVVVTAHDRQRALDDGLRDLNLFVFSAGPHPSPKLYRYIVESMVPHVETALALEVEAASSRP
jgi:lysophospholipase L1-like esterase